MADSVLETLLVLVKGDSSQLQRELDRIQRETAETGSKVRRSLDFREIGAGLTGLASGGGVLYALREMAGESARTESALRSFDNTVRRTGDFTDPPPEIVVTPYPCHRCCYPKLCRYLNTRYPEPVRLQNLRLIDDLLPACPVCSTPNDGNTFYQALHSHYPNGRHRYDPGEPLELHRKPTELLAGTRPTDYGVEIPELGDYFLREEPS